LPSLNTQARSDSGERRGTVPGSRIAGVVVEGG